MLDPIGSVAASLPSPGAAGEAAGSAADAQQFAALLPPGAAPTSPTVPEAGLTVRLAPPSAGTGLGDAILGSLQRFGQSVQTIGAAMGAPPPRGPAAAPLTVEAPKPDAAAAVDPRVQAAFDKVQHLFDEGMASQAKMYGATFDIGLVQSSMESVNKSLKTLLTQGG